MANTGTAHPTHSAHHPAGKFTSRQRTIALIIVALAFAVLLITGGRLGDAYVFSTYWEDAQPWQFILGLLLNGTGMGFIMGLMFSVTLKDVDTKHAGSASGTLNAVSQLGGAIGIAIVGVIFFGHLTSNATTSFSTVEPQIRSELTSQMVPTQSQDAILKNIKACYIDHTSQKDSTQTPESCKTIEITSATQTPGSQNLALS